MYIVDWDGVTVSGVVLGDATIIRVNVGIRLIGLKGKFDMGNEVCRFSCMFDTYGANVAM